MAEELGRDNKEWSDTERGFCSACWYCFANCLAYLISGCGCLCCVMLPNMCCWQYKLCSSCCYSSFQELEPQLDTGDVFVFGGTRILKYAQMSTFSHLGMVYVDREGWVKDHAGRQWPKGTKFIFEANYSGDGQYDGACFVPLEYKVRNYKKGRTDVAYRPMGRATKEAPGYYDRMDHAVKTLQHTPYDHDEARGLNAILDCCSSCERADDTTGEAEPAMFCSELIIAVYQIAGVLAKPPDGPPHSEYVPRDFAKQCSANIESRLLEELFEGGALIWIDRGDKRWCFNYDWPESPLVLLCCCCCNAKCPCGDVRACCCSGSPGPEAIPMPPYIVVDQDEADDEVPPAPEEGGAGVVFKRPPAA
eukprot:TRINITY_DN16978_c0_g1_i13.p1 TRINITY_DN16978_c0_g1~~TRINITY_DN16978_c0_g1_i13.p1  ORF type:complete len:363 (+),score=87.31 TRINITY_DN16978_c0_g1_i13:50-1138(+)